MSNGTVSFPQELSRIVKEEKGLGEGEGEGGYNHNVIAQNKQNPKFIDNNIYHIQQHVLVINQRITTSGSFEG